MRIKRYAPPRLSRRVKIETLQTAGFPAVLYSESAGMMELADMQDLGSCAVRRVGSSPTFRTEN